MRFCRSLLAVVFLALPCFTFAQSTNASLTGFVDDPSKAVLSKVSITAINTETGIRSQTFTNSSGQYVLPALPPGSYRIEIDKQGFKGIIEAGLVLHVQDIVQMNFHMAVGSSSETVTVNANDLQLNTTDASVSTVIDRNFVKNIPLNGRSFQDLISLTPGVVTATPQTQYTSPGTNGDFSVNGQRTESNYYIVDGVSANGGTSVAEGTGPWTSGITPATSALGTTQSLLSVDALQEFRVESSSYSAAYGHSPGGQFTFVTRSGTNAFHGSAYDYLRNGYFDANNWFNDRLGQPKVSIHQNDFGGTLGGPLWIPGIYKGTDRTFFFVSYEGLRLTEPTAASIQYVPDTYMRQQAPSAIQPILNAFPLPSPSGIDYGTPQSPSLAQFFEGYSLPGKINSTSLRIDQTVTPRLSLFYRLGYTPSSVNSRILSALTTEELNDQTHTIGATYTLSSRIVTDFRLGYSRSGGIENGRIDSFGGATPVDLTAAMGITLSNGSSPEAQLSFSGIGSPYLLFDNNQNKASQWNINDIINIKLANHDLKLGIDYRQFTTSVVNPASVPTAIYESPAHVLSNTADVLEVEYFKNPKPIYNQFALFAQDEWRLTSTLNLSLGLRWEVAPPPSSDNNNKPYIVLGDLNTPSTLSLSAPGASLWNTAWYNFAPRLGIAWKAQGSPGHETVFRVGGGVFFDTDNEATSYLFSTVGFSALGEYSKSPLPFTAAQQDIPFSTAPPYNSAVAFPSNLQLPYALQWNTSLEEALGTSQTLTLSYLGSEGRRLIGDQERSFASLNPDFRTVYYFAGGLTSNYQAFQSKFQRRVTAGVNSLISYTWSHSIDDGSNYAALPFTRGNSDFDVRHNLQAGITWDIPAVRSPNFVSTAFSNWGLDGRFAARTGFPVNVLGNLLVDPGSGKEYYSGVNLVSGVPLYLSGFAYPGGRIINKAAFSLPSGLASGDAPRNFVRGFGMSQIDLAVRRTFKLSDLFALQFRAEAFNLLNHPVFGYVNPTLTNALFGQATQTLNQSLGTVASQYQQGGPRSMQFSLRLTF